MNAGTPRRGQLIEQRGPDLGLGEEERLGPQRRPSTPRAPTARHRAAGAPPRRPRRSSRASASPVRVSVRHEHDAARPARAQRRRAAAAPRAARRPTRRGSRARGPRAVAARPAANRPAVAERAPRARRARRHDGHRGDPPPRAHRAAVDGARRPSIMARRSAPHRAACCAVASSAAWTAASSAGPDSRSTGIGALRHESDAAERPRHLEAVPGPKPSRRRGRDPDRDHRQAGGARELDDALLAPRGAGPRGPSGTTTMSSPRACAASRPRTAPSQPRVAEPRVAVDPEAAYRLRRDLARRGAS